MYKNKFFLVILVFILASCDSSDSNLDGQDHDILNTVLNESFNDILMIRKDSKTYAYLSSIAEEAINQAEGKSKYGLPLLYKEQNFPNVYNYYNGSRGDNTAVRKTMIGWLCAMQLSELCPSKRNALYKAGYEAGGQGMNSPLYGYHFSTDPNVARLVASAVYSAMHSLSRPDIEAMRDEVGGEKYHLTLGEILLEESRYHVTDDAFYVDLRKFMASAPGPYAPGYTDRSGINPTFPDEKTPNGCLKIDMDIYNEIVENKNLPDQRTVQAIADEDADMHHIFGTDKRNIGGHYNFNAVFGESTIGATINPQGKIAEFGLLTQNIGSVARSILQHNNSSLGHYEYGRLRPGCSEEMEARRKSYSDDRLNVLSNFMIEDNDGHRLTYEDGGIEKYYYDENGNWTNAIVQSPEQYEDMAKDLLWANSYPSGHSSSIWSLALSLIEVFPQKADLIMKAANDFAVSRTIARYHWNSDIIQGRVIGSVIIPLCHATTDYEDLLEEAKREIQ